MFSLFKNLSKLYTDRKIPMKSLYKPLEEINLLSKDIVKRQAPMPVF